MTSRAARVLLLRIGAAVQWPVLARRTPLMSGAVGPGRVSLGVERSVRGLGASVRALGKGGQKAPGRKGAGHLGVPDARGGAEESAVAGVREGEAESESESESVGSEISTSTAETELTSASGSGSESSGASPTKKPWPANFAFAFDIDGVLLHKSNPIPGATQTLKYLQQHKIPFILLTNGGGKPEAERVAELSAKLDVVLDKSAFVQSHTPYRLLTLSKPRGALPQSGLPDYLSSKVRVQSLRESTVLVLGSDASKARRIARDYGFQSVVTPGDILKANPEIFPFDPLTEFYDKQEILPLPKPIYNPKNPDIKLEDCLKIDAILVFNDPRDWAVDIQLIVDLLISHRGYLGTRSTKNGKYDNKWQTDGQPALVFSNVDLLWSTGYSLPRFGQGAFRAAVLGAFREFRDQAHGYPINPNVVDFQFGKPHPATYAFATRKLTQYLERLQDPSRGRGLSDDGRTSKAEPSSVLNHKTIYMVGDNPESDIRGALRWSKILEKTKMPQPLWQACLVRTGVWSEAMVPLEELDKRDAMPDTVQDDVKAVVNWVLEKEGWPERLE